MEDQATKQSTKEAHLWMPAVSVCSSCASKNSSKRVALGSSINGSPRGVHEHTCRFAVGFIMARGLPPRSVQQCVALGHASTGNSRGAALQSTLFLHHHHHLITTNCQSRCIAPQPMCVPSLELHSGALIGCCLVIEITQHSSWHWFKEL